MMLPFMNSRYSAKILKIRMFANSAMNISKAVKKLNSGELKLEDILDDEDVVSDIKNNPNSQLAPFFSREIIKNLIDYVTLMPTEENHKTGHKFPFNACEILSSENNFILDKLFESVKEECDPSERKHSDMSDIYKDDHSESDDSDKSEDSSHNDIVKFENIDLKLENTDIKKNHDNNENNQILTSTNDQVENHNNSCQEHAETSKDSDIVNNNIQNEPSQNEENSNNKHNGEIHLENKKIHHKKTHGGTQDFIDDEDIFNISQEESVSLGQNEKSEKQTTNYKITYIILDYFYNFLQSPGKLDFVLAGYFSKIFNNLINQRTYISLKYLLYYKFEIIDLFIKNINRKSIAECLIRILTSNTEDIKEGMKKKVEIIDKILNTIEECSLNHNQDVLDTFEQIETISNLFIECLSNKRFYSLFMTNISLLKKLSNVIFSQFKNEIVVKELLKIMIKINENILKDFGNHVTPVFTQENQPFMFNFNNFDDDNQGPSDYNKISETFDLQSHLESIIDILAESTNHIASDFVSASKKDDSSINTTFDRSKNILGEKRLLEFEYVKGIIDILINGYANGLFVEKIIYIFDIIINSNFFKAAIDNFFIYEFNNAYQKLFEQLIILVTNKHSPENLIKHIFSTEEYHSLIYSPCDFFSTIINKCNSQENIKFVFNSGKTINNGYLAILCEICNHICISENTTLREIIKKSNKKFLIISDLQFLNFFTTFIEPIRNRFNQGLLYRINNKVTNLDRLSSSVNEFEFAIEEKSKELENFPPSISLNEIIENGIINFSKGNYSKKSIVSIDSFNNVNLDNINPIEEDEDMKCYFDSPKKVSEDFPKGNLDQGFAEDKPDVELTNNNENIFEVRYIQKESSIEPVELPSNLECALTESATKQDTEYYDNTYWKRNSTVGDEILKDLLI